jgi:hypothetical protein
VSTIFSTLFGGIDSRKMFLAQYRHDLMPHEDRMLPSASAPADLWEHDTMGVAYFQIGVSDEVKDLLASQPELAQRDEPGVDLFYNARSVHGVT